MVASPEQDGAVPDSGDGSTAPESERLISTTDYEQTVGYINLLTDVRFKLAAFVPALTGAAVALLNAADVGPLVQTLFGLAGLCFALGIVVYDLRNSQLYNGAVGRAAALESALRLPRFGGDDRFGLFGSRSDTTDAHEAKGSDRFLGFAVRHGTGLALVYTATLTAWVWVVLDAIADALTGAGWDADWQPAAWLLEDPHAHWVAAALAMASAVLIWNAHSGQERREDRPPAVLIHLSPAESAALDRLVGQRGSSRQEILHQAIARSGTLGAESSQGGAGSVTDGDRAVPLRLTPSELTALAPWSERSDERVSEALRAFVREHDEGPPAD